MYFGEVEDPSDSDEFLEPSVKKPRTRQSVSDFKLEIAETRSRIRQLEPRLPDDFNVPSPVLPHRPDDSEDDDDPRITLGPQLFFPSRNGNVGNVTPGFFERPPSGGYSNGEDGLDENTDHGSEMKIYDVAFGISGSRKIFLTSNCIRKILNFKESIFKYGVLIPKNDHEADSAPESKRWISGKELEWLRTARSRDI